MEKEKIAGTIRILGDWVPKEIRCPYECDGGDVTVSTETGICSVCKRKFKIVITKFELVEKEVV